jgi:hypothetical protein
MSSPASIHPLSSRLRANEVGLRRRCVWFPPETWALTDGQLPPAAGRRGRYSGVRHNVILALHAEYFASQYHSG